ncbi:MAG: hypothetical protein UV27_C0004G0046 [candidate division WWE3 bacterium GW2011_GWA1_42_46]|nr:MAG: hypothetical protein UU86_C0038G0001 [candidate division WWE3 bacterium GW2011_GWC1_42_102]KKS61223.1 MAG: hypothetical protein UV27_C0004G0046 [candidate division WWE3 bacterium GW2011_GWA1_42_46]
MSKVEDADLVGSLRKVEKVRVTFNWLPIVRYLRNYYVNKC